MLDKIVNLSISITLTTIILSCNSTPNQIKGEFEGIITYKNTYKNFADSLLYGDTMRVTYSKGNLLYEYNSKVPNGIRKMVYLWEKPSHYTYVGESDTALTYDITSWGGLVRTSSVLSKSREVILGHKCEKLSRVFVHLGKETFYMYEKYVFSKEMFKVNKAYFKNWNHSYFNDFISESGVFYMKYENEIKYGENLSFGTKISQAVSVEQKPISPKVFYVDTSKLKELAL